tara:strand:- start:363 stop:701 length:339 start_codon:yes stop_codon:yes gene_type:complete
MQAPAPSQAPNTYRTCNACGAKVHREEVHKNRYGQYICKACHTDGVRVVGRHRLHYLVRRMPIALAAFLVVLAVLVVLPLALVLLLELHSYSNAGMVEDLKDMVRSLNQWAR